MGEKKNNLEEEVRERRKAQRRRYVLTGGKVFPGRDVLHMPRRPDPTPPAAPAQRRLAA